MNKYAIFGGLTFAPRGGMLDLCGSADTVDAAYAKVVDLQKKHRSDFQWWHIADTGTGSIVASSNNVAVRAEDPQTYHLLPVCELPKLTLKTV